MEKFLTKKGLSFISSAFTSELLISLLHHPLRNGAPGKENGDETILGQYILF